MIKMRKDMYGYLILTLEKIFIKLMIVKTLRHIGNHILAYNLSLSKIAFNHKYHKQIIKLKIIL